MQTNNNVQSNALDIHPHGRSVSDKKSPSPHAIPSVADSGYGAENSPSSLDQAMFRLSVGFVQESDGELDEELALSDEDDVFGIYGAQSSSSDSNIGSIDTDWHRTLHEDDHETSPSHVMGPQSRRDMSGPICIENSDSFRDTESDPCGEDTDSVDPIPALSHSWSVRSRQRYIFGHSCGTQTSDMSCQHSELRGTSQSSDSGCGIQRVNSAIIPQSSTSYPPLPDVIPQRGRSVSTSAVPITRTDSEQSVGLELRRISDEFHTTRCYKYKYQKSNSSSAPLSASLHSYWAELRRIVSTPVFRPGSHDHT